MQPQANGSSSRRSRFYFLPNFITTLGLLSGFYAIIAAINGLYWNSSAAILLAGVFDGIDGRLARLTGTESKFGKEYDSLCDLISFGLAPAILAYELCLRGYGRFGWLAAFLYVATTALRLARFNCQSGSSSRSFIGLPCPAAAATIAASVLFFRFIDFSGRGKDLTLLLLVYALSYLMVSTFPYPSFKKFEHSGFRRFQQLVGMVLLIVVIAAEPQVTLFLAGGTYLLSGPFLYLRHKLRQPAGQAEGSGAVTRKR
ncbi:MAG: CDP-diacylglycerol--serine O-phosphatidyltransferase [Thermodesulfobacteriota bacterium]